MKLTTGWNTIPDDLATYHYLQCVGTWRSAGNRGGFWGVAVKGCVAIGILETAVGYAILFT
jgi:hypothetical protein